MKNIECKRFLIKELFKNHKSGDFLYTLKLCLVNMDIFVLYDEWINLKEFKYFSLVTDKDTKTMVVQTNSELSHVYFENKGLRIRITNDDIKIKYHDGIEYRELQTMIISKDEK